MSDSYSLTPFNGGLTTDDTPLDPLAGVILTNADTAAVGTATVVLSATANGTLSNLTTGALSTDGGTYTVTGTAAQIQAALRALVFTPTQHEVAPGQVVVTNLAITVADTASTVTGGPYNNIYVTAVANVPAVHVTQLPAFRTDAQTATPFNGVTITDPDAGVSETATITLTAGGSATDANGALSGAGLTKTGVGTYVLATGSPSAVQSALDALVFTPAALNGAASATTQFTLQVANNDGAATTVTIGQTISDATPAPDTSHAAQVPGDPNTFTSTSETTETSTIDAPATQTNTAYETTITAVLNGGVTVYQQSFALPYADPAVQEAVAQADLILAGDGATAATPSLTSSQTTSQTYTAPATQSSVKTITVTTNFGPGTIGPFDVGGTFATQTPNAAITLLAGQELTNVNTDTQTVTDPTASAITTNLLTQDYTIESAPSVACFAAGTRIATPRGQVAVEDLRLGDEVLTQEGVRTIRWMGRRRIDLARHPHPDRARPIRIAAHAFAPGRPARDLTVSPDHAIFHDGVLVPAKRLLNGRTVTQLRPRDVTYFHIELPRHGIVFAENLPAESYLDTGNRGMFQNAWDALILHPDFPIRGWQDTCAPLALSGEPLARIRRHLFTRAAELGHATSADPDLHLLADGVRIDAQPVPDGSFWLAIPPGIRRLRLVSRSGLARDLLANSVATRRLGVSIARLALTTARGPRDLPLDDSALTTGWHRAEPGRRWTNGRAGLVLRGPVVLHITLAERPAYPQPRRIAARIASYGGCKSVN